MIREPVYRCSTAGGRARAAAGETPPLRSATVPHQDVASRYDSYVLIASPPLADKDEYYAR